MILAAPTIPFILVPDRRSANAVAIIAFWTTSAVITYLVSGVRKLAKEALSEIEERKRAEEVLRVRSSP